MPLQAQKVSGAFEKRPPGYLVGVYLKVTVACISGNHVCVIHTIISSDVAFLPKR